MCNSIDHTTQANMSSRLAVRAIKRPEINVKNIRIEKLRSEYLQRIELQNAQALNKAEIIKPDYFNAITSSGSAYALVHVHRHSRADDVLACYGTQKIWDGRAVIWALLSHQSRRFMVLFHRVAQGFVAQLPMRRVAIINVMGEEGIKSTVQNAAQNICEKNNMTRNT